MRCASGAAGVGVAGDPRRAEHADITLAVRGGRLESRAATSELPSRIDDLQQEVDDGPCLQAIWEHETVRVDDMAHEDRWPRFAPRAADAGIGSMLAFQFYTTESNLGALNLLSASPHAFDAASVSVGGSLATHAAIAVIAVIAVIAAQREGATSPRGMNALPPDSSIPAKEEVDPLRLDDIDLPREPSSTLRPGASRSRTWASSAPEAELS